MCIGNIELNIHLCRISAQDLLNNVVLAECCSARGIILIQYLQKHKEKTLQNLGVPVSLSR
jgi:hypothetical protein